MDSQLFEVSAKMTAAAHLVRVRHAIRNDNWTAAESIARSLAACVVPDGQPERAAYLEDLKQTVIQAKAARSLAMASLSRVRAAARFQSNTIAGRIFRTEPAKILPI
jgi:hypothetical protein